jgi:transposase InsO family protein
VSIAKATRTASPFQHGSSVVRRSGAGCAPDGYRRITALLNRQANAEGLARVNHKRVYRVMKQAGLLLAPHTGRGRQRRHDGEVATPASNRRWAADVFEIPCWNGDALRIAFAIDTPTTARCSPGLPVPAGSAASQCAI